MKAAIVFALCVACGGRIEDVDGGADAGAKSDAAPDVAPSCHTTTGATDISSDGTCISTQKWACGTQAFAITCKCPDAACTCQQGADSKTILTTIACPSCDVPDNLEKLAALCGYPAP